MSKDFLEQIEHQLVEATERGGKRRRFWRRGLGLLRVPTVGLAAAGVTVVTATALAATLALPASHPKRAANSTVHTAQPRQGAVGTDAVNTVTATGTTTTAGAPAGPVPAGFQPQSFTAISEFTWWLLGQAPCGSPPCTSIVRTDDGGRTFVGMPAPRTDAVTSLRFADSRDGYAFGTELWTTHDQGQTWTQIDLGGDVSDLEPGIGYVYATVHDTGDGTARLMRSPTYTDDWTTVLSSANGIYGIWVHGNDVITDVGTATGNRLALSTDDGSSFTEHPAPPSVACNFEQQGPGVVWAPCATGMMAGIWRSTDGGARFVPVAGDATSNGPQFPNSVAFGAATSSVAVMGFQTLYYTTDGGRTLHPSAAPAAQDWRYIGFTDDTHGVAIGQFGNGTTSTYRLYYTVDGGQSFHYVPIDG